MGAIQERLKPTSYQRGVHKGSLISPDEYLWDDNMSMDMGLQRQRRARQEGNVLVTQRFAPGGNPVEILAHEGKTSGLATPGELGEKMQEAKDAGVNVPMNPIVVQDPANNVHMHKMLPKYRTLG